MHKNIYIRFSAIFFFFFLSWAASYTLISIWMGQVLHLSGVKIGFLYSVNGIFTLLLQPLYGYFLDRLGMRKSILFFLSGILVLMGPFFIYIYGPLLQKNFPLGIILGGIFLSGSYLASMGAVESYIEKASRKYKFEYGHVRMWGSLGTAIAAFFAGSIFNINPNYNFWIGSIAAIFILIILCTTKINITDVEIKDSKSVRVKDVFELSKLKKFWIFVVFIIGVASMYTIYDQQFPRYFAEQFATIKAGNQMYGYLNSLQTFLEAGMMFVTPKIVNKLGARNSMLLMGFLVAVRVVLTGIVSGPILISVVKLIQAFDFPLLYIAIFKYININFESRLSSILYLIGYQFFSQIGVIGVSTPIGRMYDTIGYRPTYMYLGIIILFFVLIGFLTLSKDSGVSLENN
ncbi:oligosaccharide MFS transporter [Companilactobacillus paralimentarius]|uniref:oligosaccharide MFS transporter n=1 Tax=Companilactobacillus paralimentarius TaxID=83526 RepID=UPI002852FBBD|nr:oligosaccharide MFS transporter [Companilactobacillus paralimentarius]MDR4933039.1 oligosaccharide MFS transporter [Companilactobacillus paralimentarius]